MIYWEQRKLGEVTTSYSGGTPNVSNCEYYGDEIPFIRSGEINNCHTDLFITEKGLLNSSAAMVKEGDILYALYGATSGEVSRSKLKGAINQAILAILPKTKYDSEYIAQWLKIKKRYIVDTYLQGGQGNLSGNIVKNFIVDFSSYNEQLNIGNLASSLDHLITLHQSKSFRHILKAIVSCTLSWEQRKLGEVGKARSGIGFPDSEQGGTIGTPFFKVSDMNIDGNENEMTAANNYVTTAQIVAHKWSPIEELPAIFFAKVGAAVMLNRKRLCRFPFLLDNNTMAYSLDKTKWDADFAKALFETVDLTSLVQVGALPSYNSGDIEAMEILLPSLSEQSQIGAFFKKIDNLITLHQLEPFQLIFKAIAYRIIDYTKSKPPRHTKYEIIISFIKYYV
nr:restriction endonuclease subunit S [uncultured Lachnoanaerobaculum sp.]